MAQAALGAAVSGATYIKVGLYGCTTPEQAVDVMRGVVRAVKDYRPDALVVASGYADAHRIGCVGPLALPDIAHRSGSDAAMLDTAIKDGSRLFDHVPPEVCAEFVRLAHEAGLLAALAGSVKAADLAALTRIGTDIVGVRGAVCEGGARQVVLLGAGLDTRAFRLDWPPGCVIFEIDREGVPAFKHKVPGGLSAAPKAARVPIPRDLRADWAGALTGSGFDPAAPSVWLAEGLLFYLPSAAETYLIDTIDRLSTARSALAYEVKLEKDLLAYRDSPLYTSTKHQIGIDLLDLFVGEPRPDSAADLADKGWSASVRTPFDFTRRLGRGPLPEDNDALAGNRWVFANKPR